MMLNMDMGTSRSLLAWFMEWREAERCSLIVLSTINSIPLGLAYIAIFGAGSIGGMTAISTLIGIPFVKLANSAKVSLLLRYAAAITTLAIGTGMIYDLVWIDKIFAS